MLKQKNSQNILGMLKSTVIFLLCGNFFVSCSDVSESKEIELDKYFSELFIRTGDGFTGGDGTYSVKLPDGRTVWIFGDTFLGSVETDGSRKKLDPMFIRNSFVVQDGNQLSTLHQKFSNEDHSTIIPPQVINSNFEITEEMQWYWPGDGFIENNELKVFVSEFHLTGDGMWDFKWVGTALASFSLPDLKQTNLVQFDYNSELGVHYGHAVLETEDFTYVYGIGKHGKPHVARVQTGNIEAPWEFHTNYGWSSNPAESSPMADVDGSEQFTVMKWKGKFVFITQLGALSKEICSFTSDKPNTGWQNKQLLYSTPISEGDSNLFTYNAVAHPQFIENETLLVSYNTNSFILSDHFNSADIYRPRFFRVPLISIDKDF